MGVVMKIGCINVRELVEKYGTPLYVYDFQHMKENAESLKNAFKSSNYPIEIYYSMKANPHPSIVKWLWENGFGAECASPGEIQAALHAGVSPDRILYTGNYESVEDFHIVFKSDAQINLDDISSLYRLLKVGKPERISYRINPGKGKGKYKQITTGGIESKFGVPHEKAVLAYKNALNARINRFGAHMMSGSGTLDKYYFPAMVELFLEILHRIRDALNIKFEFINIGGGFGIPYFDDGEPLDIDYVAREIIKIYNKKVEEYDLGNSSLILEPGRYLVGDTGYLISRVNGIKESYKTFIGIDAGMNTLIRPALYQAQHSITVDGKEDSQEKVLVNICGQICENTDILARDRLLPPLEEGDLIIFSQAGAYCSTMTMQYNLRLRPAEVAVIDEKDYLITRREEMSDFLNRISMPSFL